MSEGAAQGPLLDDELYRRLARLALVTRRRSGGRLPGARRTRRIGPGSEIVDHRPYVPGDDVRLVDWALAARQGRPYVRLHEEEGALPLDLLIDASASMGFGAPSKLALACRIAVALAVVGAREAGRITVATFSDRVHEGPPPAQGPAALRPVVRHLAQVRPTGRTDLEAAIANHLTRRSGPGLCVLLSDFHDPKGFERGLVRLARARVEVAIIAVLASEELEGLPEGDARLVDAETGAERDVAVDERANEAYRERLAHRRAALARACRRSGIPFAEVQTSMRLETVVQSTLRTAGLLH